MFSFLGLNSNEEKIKKLTDLGFPKDQVKEALKKCNDDPETAANYLL